MEDNVFDLRSGVRKGCQLSTSSPHCAGTGRQGNEVSQRNKRHNDWKGGSKIAFIHRQDEGLHRASERIYSNATRSNNAFSRITRTKLYREINYISTDYQQTNDFLQIAIYYNKNIKQRSIWQKYIIPLHWKLQNTSEKNWRRHKRREIPSSCLGRFNILKRSVLPKLASRIKAFIRPLGFFIETDKLILKCIEMERT